MAFKKIQSWHTLILKYTGGAQNDDFSAALQKDFTRGLVSSVSQATYFLTWRYFTLLRVKAKIKNTHATTGTVVYLIPWNIMKKSYSQELQEVLHLKEQCHKDIAVLCQFWTEVIT